MVAYTKCQSLTMVLESFLLTNVFPPSPPRGIYSLLIQSHNLMKFHTPYVACVKSVIHTEINLNYIYLFHIIP